MASRRGLLGWIEMEVPPPPTNRRGLIGWLEMEVPDLPRRGLIGWLEMEVPDFQQFPNTAFIQGFQSASEAVAALAVVDAPIAHPYLQALAVALKEVAAQGEPVTGTQSGTPGKLVKFAGSTRIQDSLISESGNTVAIAATGGVSISGSLSAAGNVASAIGLSSALLASNTGGGTDPALLLRTLGATKGIVGVAAEAGDLLGGSAAGDLIVRTQGGSIRMTVNSGASAAMVVNSAGIDHIGVHRIAGVQVLGQRKTGYVALTGTANRGGSFDTSTITTAQLAQRVKALQDDLTLHGAIGV